MTVSGSIFRERAMQHISSPEQLDRLVRVTTPRRWVGLAGLLLLVVSAVVWSSVSTVPTQLTRPGYFRPLDGIWPMQAPVGGIVSRFELKLGQSVGRGAPLAEISPPGGGAPVPVPSVVSGVVTEIDTTLYTAVSAGQTLAVVNPTNVPSVIYSFPPTATATSMPSGLAVRVLFGGGVGARYGFALGHVESVSIYPPTEAYLTWLLPEVPVGVIGPVGSVSTAVIVLDPDGRAPSGILWESGAGPPAKLPAGLPASVTILLGSHHPIDDVL